jgi:hypothetical protein
LGEGENSGGVSIAAEENEAFRWDGAGGRGAGRGGFEEEGFAGNDRRLWVERFSEGAIEVDWAVLGAENGLNGVRADRFRRHARIEIELKAYEVLEDFELVTRLVRRGFSEFCGAIGGEEDEGDARVMGFHHGGEEIADGRSGGDDDGGWFFGGKCTAYGVKSESSFIEVGMEFDSWMVRSGKGEWRAP